MTTALLLILPVIATLIVGVIAKIMLGGEGPQLESISSVWPTVIDALPPADDEHEQVGRAA